MEFSLESYGLGDDRVLRYLNGSIIKETPVQHYFTLLEKLKKDKEVKEEVKEDEGYEFNEKVKEENELELDKVKLEQKDYRNNDNKEDNGTKNKNKKQKNKVKLEKDNNQDEYNKDNRHNELSEKQIEIDDKFLSELNKLNCSNWNLIASTICMASTLSNQKELPLEWDESKLDQLSGYNTLAKIKGIFDHLNQTKNLQLSHIVNKQESKTLKYSIFNRNEKLDEISEKTLNLSNKILKSLNLQTKFLKIIKDIKNEFKVYISHRNPVDLTSLDVDYPTSFSINVLFYDITYYPGNVNLVNYYNYTHFNEEEDSEEDEFNYVNQNKVLLDMESFDSQKENIWDLWELHNIISPYTPQQCLVSYYESENDVDELNTRLTFPQQISHFIEDNYTLYVNSATVPLYKKDENYRLLYHLRRSRTCLIDRFIFCILSQYCYCNIKAGRNFIHIGDSTIFIKNISSDTLFIVCENEDLKVSYKPSDSEEKGETIWKLLVAKLRDLHVQNWKKQKYLLSNKTHNLLGEFLKYSIKLIRYRNKHYSK